MKQPRLTGLPSPREVGAAYDRHFSEAPLRDSARYYRWLAQQVVEHIPNERRTTARVVDVGCGGGYLLAALAELCPQASVLGVDLSREALRLARASAPRATLVYAQGERLPLPSRRFDAVLCSGKLEHFVDQELCAAEFCLLYPSTRPRH